MKDYFIKLFKYDHYVNHIIVDALLAAGKPEETRKLMAHLLGAQQVWLLRCKRENVLTGPIWPDTDADMFKQIIDDNHNQWIAFLSALNESDFATKITYRDFKGDEFSNKLEDMLTQVTNHGTHHRAQIGQLLKEADKSLPITDYIFYIRNQH
ncbi:hypothetical protein GCM10027049_18560 [Mucilaginibacter puniceus]